MDVSLREKTHFSFEKMRIVDNGLFIAYGANRILKHLLKHSTLGQLSFHTYDFANIPRGKGKGSNQKEQVVSCFVNAWDHINAYQKLRLELLLRHGAMVKLREVHRRTHQSVHMNSSNSRHWSYS